MMSAIVNGLVYEVRNIYHTSGLDMECRPVTVEVMLIRILSTGELAQYEGYDCVIISDGIRVLASLGDLSIIR